MLAALAVLAVEVEVGVVVGQEAQEVAVVVVMKQQVAVAVGGCSLSP